jgi:hypothetical protein
MIPDEKDPESFKESFTGAFLFASFVLRFGAL